MVVCPRVAAVRLACSHVALDVAHIEISNLIPCINETSSELVSDFDEKSNARFAIVVFPLPLGPNTSTPIPFRLPTPQRAEAIIFEDRYSAAVSINSFAGSSEVILRELFCSTVLAD